MAKRKTRTFCKTCGAEPVRASYVYCSNSCQQEYQYNSYIENWKRGNELGLQSGGVVSRYIKRYLREKYKNKCLLCGWGKVNKVTGIVPLIADHIDGDWKNNNENNLRLLCPNCDSLQSTYAALNKGRGREGRVTSKRLKESKLFLAKQRSQKG